MLFIYLHVIAFRMPYKELFGGAISLNPAQFESVNGFSNEFYGWGGEDDDMYRRSVTSSHLSTLITKLTIWQAQI